MEEIKEEKEKEEGVKGEKEEINEDSNVLKEKEEIKEDSNELKEEKKEENKSDLGENDNNNFLDTMFNVLKEVTDDIKKRKTPTKNKDN